MTSICRIGVVRDEVDIIDQNIRWYLDQGFPTILLDNGSTDGTYEICQSYRGQGIVRLERVPFDEHDREYSLRELAKLTADSGFKWLLLADADEFYESPVKEERLNQSLEREIQMGYNIVKFHNMEFWMTERDNPEEPDIMKRIRHYSYFDSNRYKLFPNLPGIDFWTKFGHVPILPGSSTEYHVSPKVHISRHYKFRSLEQGLRKVSRIRPPSRRKDMSFHYLDFTDNPQDFIIPSERLTECLEDGDWNLERTFDGRRMSRERLMQYLGLQSEQEFINWLMERGLRE